MSDRRSGPVASGATTDHEVVPAAWWVPVGVAAVAVCLLGVCVGWLWLHVSGTTWHMIDLGVYRWGGETIVGSEADLYATQWDGSAIAGYHDGPLSFTYTPFAALTFVAITPLGITAAQVVASLLGAASLAYVVRLGVRGLGFAPSRPTAGLTATVTASALLLEPVSQTLFFGQINLLLMAMVLADVCRRPSRTSGVLIGLASGIKLTPAIFIVYLFAARRFRAGLTAVVTAAATVVVGLVLAPQASREYWGDRRGLDSDRVGGIDFVSNQSLAGGWARAFDSTDRSLGPVVLGLGLVLVAIWCAVRFTAAGRTYWAASAVALGGLLVSPISWTHHWVWIVPILLSVVGAVRASLLSRWALVPASVISILFLAVPLVPGAVWFVGERSSGGAAEVIGTNLYLLCGAVLLVLLVLASASLPRRSGSEVGPRSEVGLRGA